MNFTSRFVISAVTVVASAVGSATAEAQSCLGLPQRSSVAFESGRYNAGTSAGVNAALSGKHVALDLAYRSRDINDNVSGYEGALGFSIVIPISRVKLCPGLGLSYERDDWEIDQTTSLYVNQAAARAGAGLGFEQRVAGDLVVIPFLGVYYQFKAYVFQYDAPGGSNDYSGDTLSHVLIDYGAMAQFRFLYGGISATRASDIKGSHPVMSRLVIGLTIPTSAKKSKAQAKIQSRK